MEFHGTRRILRVTKLERGLLRVEELAEKPLAFTFAPVVVDLGANPFSAPSTPHVKGLGVISRASAFARPWPDSDPSEWLEFGEITLTETGASGIRRAGLPAGQVRLEFRPAAADMPRLATMAEFLIRAEWVLADVNWEETDEDDPELHDVRVAYARDLLDSGMNGSFEYRAAITVDE
jgi:hypothetical protein